MVEVLLIIILLKMWVDDFEEFGVICEDSVLK